VSDQRDYVRPGHGEGMGDGLSTFLLICCKPLPISCNPLRRGLHSTRRRMVWL